MAKNKDTSLWQNSGIVMVISFLVLWLVNAVVIYLINAVWGEALVLGTLHLGKTAALLMSSGALALINTFTIPFVNEYESRRGRPMTSSDWMVAYFVINFVGVWLVSRMAVQLGLGISAWWVAAVVAVVLDVVQGIVMMQMEKMRVKK